MSKLESRIVSGEDDEEDEEEYSPSIQSQDTRDFPRSGQPLLRPTLISSAAIMFGPSKGDAAGEDDEEEYDDGDEGDSQKPGQGNGTEANIGTEYVGKVNQVETGTKEPEGNPSNQAEFNARTETTAKPDTEQHNQTQKQNKPETASSVQKKQTPNTTQKPNMTAWFKSEMSHFLGHPNSSPSSRQYKQESEAKQDSGATPYTESPNTLPISHQSPQNQQQQLHSMPRTSGSSDPEDTEKENSLSVDDEKQGVSIQENDLQTGSDICPEDASHMHQNVEEANRMGQHKLAKNDFTSNYLTASTKSLASTLWKGAMKVKKLGVFDSKPTPLPPYVHVSHTELDASQLEKANHNFYDCLSTAHAKFYYDMGLCASGLLKIGDNTVVGLDKTRTYRRGAISDLRSLSQSCDEVDFVLKLNYLNKADAPSRGTSISTL